MRFTGRSRTPERTSVNCTPGSEKPSHIEGIYTSVRASVRVWRQLTEILDSGRVAIWRKGDMLPRRPRQVAMLCDRVSPSSPLAHPSVEARLV